MGLSPFCVTKAPFSTNLSVCYELYRFGAEGRARTDTEVALQQFLRLSRLPIPPLRQAEDEIQARDLFLGKEASYR
jgi:hypothetical protein